MAASVGLVATGMTDVSSLGHSYEYMTDLAGIALIPASWICLFLCPSLMPGSPLRQAVASVQDSWMLLSSCNAALFNGVETAPIPSAQFSWTASRPGGDAACFQVYVGSID